MTARLLALFTRPRRVRVGDLVRVVPPDPPGPAMFARVDELMRTREGWYAQMSVSGQVEPWSKYQCPIGWLQFERRGR